MEKKQTTSSSAGFSGKYLIALLFVLSGALLFARNMGWVTNSLFDILVSWYSILIILGAYSITRRHFFSGLLMLLIGLCFLVPHLGLAWIAVDANTLVWPVVLVAIGVAFIIKPRKRAAWKDRVEKMEQMSADMKHSGQWHGGKQQYHSADGFLRSDNVFGGVRQVVLDETFKGAAIRNTFGGTCIDLRHTHIEEGETYIDLECNWGGVEIYVPSDWNVIIRCDAFLGGCEDKRWRGGAIDKSRSLVIRGNVSFGGLEIKG